LHQQANFQAQYDSNIWQKTSYSLFTASKHASPQRMWHMEAGIGKMYQTFDIGVSPDIFHDNNKGLRQLVTN
jgi:hypothetical protein